MNGKVLPIITIAIAILFLFGYLFLIPNYQVGAYKNTVNEAQPKLDEAIHSLDATLKLDILTRTNITPTTLVSDFNKGNETIKDVESVVYNSKNTLTTLKTLPLLGSINSSYKAAEDLKNDEQDYISKTETLTSDIKASLSYREGVSDISAKFTDLRISTYDGMASETTETYTTKVNKGIESIQPSIDEFAKITPPASLKDAHDYNLKAFRDLVTLYKQSATALESRNTGLFNTTLEQIVTKGNEIMKKSDDYIATFIQSSELQKDYSSLLDIGHQVAQKQENL
ncbi:MAG TPA: hypothetical protein VJ841_04790 [Candidatus Saccharimonadales bacterium]|nr:hypothetical protein [Candidatus Saccharimonadales bacterium]